MNDRYKDRAGFVGNMKQIVERLKAAKIEVTLLSPTSTYPVNPDLKTYIPILGDMNKEIAALAAEEHVGYADAYTASAEWIAAGKPDYTWGDGIHVADAGQRFMVDALNACWHFGKPLAGEGPRPAQEIPAGDAKADKKDAAKPAKK
jgi:lysophospholipase L1-like esterase